MTILTDYAKASGSLGYGILHMVYGYVDLAILNVFRKYFTKFTQYTYFGLTKLGIFLRGCFISIFFQCR